MTGKTLTDGSVVMEIKIYASVKVKVKNDLAKHGITLDIFSNDVIYFESECITRLKLLLTSRKGIIASNLVKIYK